MPHGVSTYVAKATKCGNSFPELVSDLTAKLSNPKTRYSKEVLAQLRELCLYIAPEQELGQSSILNVLLDTAAEAGDGDNDRKVARTCYYLLTDIIQSTAQRQRHSLTPHLLDHLLRDTKEQQTGSARTSLQWRTIGRIGSAPSMTDSAESEQAKKASSAIVNKLISLKFPEKKKSFLGQKKANMEFENEIHLWISVFSAMRQCSQIPPASAVMPNILIACASPQDTLARHAFALLQKVAEANPSEVSVLLVPKLRDNDFIQRASADLFMASSLMYSYRALMVAPAAAGSTIDDTLSMLSTMLGNPRLDIQLEAARVLLESPQIWSFLHTADKTVSDPIPVLITRLLLPLLNKLGAQFKEISNICSITSSGSGSGISGGGSANTTTSLSEGLSPITISAVCKTCIRLGRYMLFRAAESQPGSSNTTTTSSNSNTSSAFGLDLFGGSSSFNAPPVPPPVSGFGSRTFAADSAIEASLLQLLDALRGCIDAMEVADFAAATAAIHSSNSSTSTSSSNSSASTSSAQEFMNTTTVTTTTSSPGASTSSSGTSGPSTTSSLPIAMSIDGGSRSLLLAAYSWIIPTPDMDRNTLRAAGMWEYISEKAVCALPYLTEPQSELLVRHLVGRVREEEDTISSPSMPLLTDVCLRVAEAAVTMHQSTHIIKQLWELYAVEFSQKFPAVSAALLASLLRCIDGTLAADMASSSIPADTASVCLGASAGVLRSNAAASRSREEAVVHTASPQKALYNLQLHACWMLGEFSYLWIDPSSSLSSAYCFDNVAYDEVPTDGRPDAPFVLSIVAIVTRLVRCLWLEAGPVQSIAAMALYKISLHSPPASGLYRYIREQFHACSAAAAGIVTAETLSSGNSSSSNSTNTGDYNASMSGPAWTETSAEAARLMSIGHDAAKMFTDPAYIRAVNRGGPFTAEVGELQRCLSAFLLAMDSTLYPPSSSSSSSSSSGASATDTTSTTATADLLGAVSAPAAAPATVTVAANKLEFLNGMLALK